MRQPQRPENRPGIALSLRLFGRARSIVFCLVWTALAGAKVAGQPLGVSSPRDILATEPGVFAQLLETARPEPVSADAKARILSSLPPRGEVTNLNASARRKLAALIPVLRATNRDAVYEIKVVDAPEARIALYERTVVLISKTALSLVNSEELQALMAHEIGHEYIWIDHERASRLRDYHRLKELELLCDAVAIVTLQRLGVDPSRLIASVEKITRHNRQHFGTAVDETGYPTLFERREFARAVRKWAARGR
jgi:predicted Zn-dependent protease